MVTNSGEKRRIYDGVYGYVELDEHEFRLVNTAIFQRLHWIKQLGPLHTIFPSAQHSRFSHTIGVFYIAKKMIEHLRGLHSRRPKYGYEFRDEKEDKILRFAALLHDIGHVPLSHIGERVLASDMERRARKSDGEQEVQRTVDMLSKEVTGQRKAWRDLFPDETLLCSRTKLHERLSAEMVLHDEEIDAVLSGVWPKKRVREKRKRRIAESIVGMNLSDIPTVLLHSELDADRLDYLLRDSFFTGVGYGHVDLDYIISRLIVHRKNDNDPGTLCVEHKGLHTVEHYILGRFFLQTQVVYNRKVRFLDLLFEDVMGYMLTRAEEEDCRLMNLSEFRDCIRAATGRDKRDHLHRIYSFTDAEVFTKMRRLHERLDAKEKEGSAEEEDLYTNDCVKTIMDGDIPDPVFHTCHRLVDLLHEKGYVKRVQREADRIADKLATRLKIYRSRIKVNFQPQEVMKYGRRFGAASSIKKRNSESVNPDPGEEDNPEAVRILFQAPGGEDRQLYAAESNASILRGLADKALLLFNCYYVRPKREKTGDLKAVEQAIGEAFTRFRERRFGRV